ncbi:ATPase subunit of ABC transporter with duplicated ATPase domains [Actinocorallia herbida]|uniref:ATPase subunit of ABC transporter with duplicated ATPase domains n=1 Tax=Actinocorallia herbida TaxID=58109 RepID=A0A3N1CYY3_9ACTN|nr:ABC-F family ATP-binding cassette domain-containing protein [Actinocorallia herbida]ROO86482.1 ATPase subunit of ABC transporter with duplicated ATPase domains [Actinocorallia herbida]
MSQQLTGITLADLTYHRPDDTPVFDGLTTTIPRGRTGLVGANGTGKTTLLRLITGDLHPTRGTITTPGTLAYLPQDLTLDTTARVDEALGIHAKRAALTAIESGDPDERHYTTLADDWDVEERAQATLGALGLDLDLDRTVGAMSGGETVLLHLAALLLRRPDILILDEPTNNLDLHARRRLYDAVDTWRTGTLLIVSHDTELLERVDRIAELRNGALTFHGGTWTDYQNALATQEEAATRTLRTAEADVRRQQRELRDAQTKNARRERHNKKMDDQRRASRIVAGAKKRSAQESAGKLRTLAEDRLTEARERRDAAADALRDDARISVDLPHTAVPAGRTVLTLDHVRPRHGALQDAHLHIHGPERIALVGRNGSGKTTLLRTLTGDLEPAEGEARTHVPTRYLTQRLDTLDPALSVYDNVKKAAPQAPDNQIRASLARFLFRGARADQPAGTLSGGERFRASLAATMLAEPAPQLLILDEPTNNLDTTSVRRLTEALASFQGALLVASHDLPFLDTLAITRWFVTGETLTETTRDDLLAHLDPEPQGSDPTEPTNTP